jgi:hypothetical protein
VIHENKDSVVLSALSLTVISLESAPTDIPLAVLYTVADPSQAMKDVPASMLPISPGTVCLLEGCIGIDPGHWLSPHRVDFDNDHSCYARTFREAMNQPNPLEIPLDEETQKMANALSTFLDLL